jgi:hypothetical protein
MRPKHQYSSLTTCHRQPQWLSRFRAQERVTLIEPGVTGVGLMECPYRESNSDASLHTDLNRACLPVPAYGRKFPLWDSLALTILLGSPAEETFGELLRLVPAALTCPTTRTDCNRIARQPTRDISSTLEGTLTLDLEIRIALQLRDISTAIGTDNPFLSIIADCHRSLALSSS